VTRKSILFLVVGLIVILSPTITGAAESGFGPDEWHQYRMHGDKNAVFDNGSDPLEYQKFETANEVRATPVIVGDQLFIGNHESGELFSFDVTTGEQLWQNEAPNWIHSEMIYHNGKVYVGFGNRFFQDNGIRGTGENGILALDADSGDILWKYNTLGEVMPTPAYYDGAVYITTGDRHLYKLDPDTGELYNKADIGSVVSMSAPNITDETLFVGGGAPKPYTFSAYDLTNDAFKWQTEFPEVYAGLDDVPPAVSENIVVTTALEKAADGENPEHFMYAMDTESGEIIWKESLGVGEMVPNNKSGAPIIYEGNIYVGSPITKTFYAYDLKSGEKLWEFENEVMKAPPVAQDGTVYFSNTKGFVYALDAETGELVAEKELNGTLAPAGPVIVNDTLFVGSQDSNVYAVPLTDFKKTESGDEAVAEGTKSSNEDGQGSGVTKYVVVGVLVIVLAVVLSMLFKRRKQ